jgi:hypothetical protein
VVQVSGADQGNVATVNAVLSERAAEISVLSYDLDRGAVKEEAC